MKNELDSERIRAALKRKRMSMTALATEAGVSRQALHRLMRPGFRPLPDSVVNVARVLDMEPADMLKATGECRKRQELEMLLNKAKAGDARAFELLPAHLSRDPDIGRDFPTSNDATTHLLLAAAAAVAMVLRPGRRIKAAISYHSERAGTGRAYVFPSRFLPPELVVQRTPKPMRERNVFGAFDLGDFQRHLAWS